MAAPRSTEDRLRDTRAHLAAPAADVWVATASADGVAHLVPLSLAWDGTRVILAAEATAVTTRNLVRAGRARLGLGPTRDVVMLDAILDRTIPVADAPADVADAYAAQSDWDPRREPQGYVYLLLTPTRVQAWREANEIAGRTLMRDGRWVDAT